MQRSNSAPHMDTTAAGPCIPTSHAETSSEYSLGDSPRVVDITIGPTQRSSSLLARSSSLLAWNSNDEFTGSSAQRAVVHARAMYSPLVILQPVYASERARSDALKVHDASSSSHKSLYQDSRWSEKGIARIMLKMMSLERAVYESYSLRENQFSTADPHGSVLGRLYGRLSGRINWEGGPLQYPTQSHQGARVNGTSVLKKAAEAAEGKVTNTLQGTLMRIWGKVPLPHMGG
eukprot:Selendium_serpulae@DN6476_c0_g2_i2.p1